MDSGCVYAHMRVSVVAPLGRKSGKVTLEDMGITEREGTGRGNVCGTAF